MKFVAISDTHGKHHTLKLPPGDVLIHAGDVSSTGKVQEIIDFLHWFALQAYEFKIFIAGNHDFYFEKESAEVVSGHIPEGVIYLENNAVTINGVKIWGSPITPWFYDWAFNRHRGAPIERYWNLIPDDADIIVTHGPVYGIQDKTKNGDHAGCEGLYQRIMEVKPAVHICGHIHEAYGTADVAGIKFINASVLNERYELKNQPVVFGFER